MFGIIIAGRPVLLSSDFIAQSDTRCVSPIIEDVGGVAELAFFLNPGTELPTGLGALLYFSVAPYTHWEVIGGIGPGRQSGIFRTGWGLRHENTSPFNIQLGISLENLDALSNLEISSKGVEDRLGFARKIAENLFNYMSSFSTGSTGIMTVPTDVFDRWLSVFESKFRRDPNFFIK